MSETELNPFYLNSNLFRVDSNLQSVGLSEGGGNDVPSVYEVSAGNVGMGMVFLRFRSTLGSPSQHPTSLHQFTRASLLTRAESLQRL